jgi:hypothetical protein
MTNDHTTTEPVTIGGWYEHTDGSRGRYAWIEGQPRLVEVKWYCAHCGEDITVAGKPDSGGDCPTCKGYLCKTCAGGWC